MREKNSDKGERGELQEGYLGVCEGVRPEWVSGRAGFRNTDNSFIVRERKGEYI